MATGKCCNTYLSQAVQAQKPNARIVEQVRDGFLVSGIFCVAFRSGLGNASFFPETRLYCIILPELMVMSGAEVSHSHVSLQRSD